MAVDVDHLRAEAKELISAGHALLSKIPKPSTERSTKESTIRNSYEVEQLRRLVDRSTYEDLTLGTARTLDNNFYYLSPEGVRYWLLGWMVFAAESVTAEPCESEPFLAVVAQVHLGMTGPHADGSCFSEFSSEEIAWIKRWLEWGLHFDELIPYVPGWLNNYPEAERRELATYNSPVVSPEIAEIEEILQLPPFSTIGDEEG